MTEIGYWNGVPAAVNRLREMDPGGTILRKGSDGKWPKLETISSVPLSSWKAWDRLERTLTLLVAAHDSTARSSPAGARVRRSP